MMTCGQRSSLVFIVAVLAGVDGVALKIFLFALLLWTGIKPSSDESSPETVMTSGQAGLGKAPRPWPQDGESRHQEIP
ncbi:hypothetical protein MTO96_040783 [Rhipicephalus appendiculatus]